jgi:hypothetical protein
MLRSQRLQFAPPLTSYPRRMFRDRKSEALLLKQSLAFLIPRSQLVRAVA